MIRKTLIIANDFPPIGGAGVQRPFYFAKYLPRFGWLPTVVTIKEVIFPVHDYSLLGQLPPDVDIRRTESFELRRLLWWGRRLRRRSVSDPPGPQTSLCSRLRSIHAWLIEDVTCANGFSSPTIGCSGRLLLFSSRCRSSRSPGSTRFCLCASLRGRCDWLSCQQTWSHSVGSGFARPVGLIPLFSGSNPFPSLAQRAARAHDVASCPEDHCYLRSYAAGSPPSLS